MTRYRDNYYITDDKRILAEHCLDVKKLLEQSYWADKRNIKTIELSIEHSLCYAIFDTEKNVMVAFARIITDYATMYYLTDVIVDKQYRGQGMGKQLMEWISNDDRLKGYGLLTTKDAQGYYSQYGFTDCKETCMCKLDKV